VSPDDWERSSFTDRHEWRAWLEANHATSEGVWLVYYKKGSDKPTVSYDEAVEEALCFGWIDSKVRSIDDERYMQTFSPRRPGSVWSRLNKERVARMVEAGRMTDVGAAKIAAAREDGSWHRLDEIDDLAVPDDLQAALDADPIASGNFAAFSASKKKPLLFWIASAKRPATRQKRIAETVRRARENNPFGD
jgi:uncharacterized protein YdeI (YjbR/CyaY-like superfamily)